MKTRLPRVWMRFGGALLLVCAGWPSAWTQPLRLYAERIEEPEAGVYAVNRLLTDHELITFIQLPDWELRREGTNRALLFTAFDLSAGIRLSFTEGTRDVIETPDRARWRDQVLARFPQSRLVREFACHADGRAGVAVDLVREVAHSTQSVFRVALVPYPGGLAEFELRTTTNHLARSTRALSLLMGSFRVQARAASP